MSKKKDFIDDANHDESVDFSVSIASEESVAQVSDDASDAVEKVVSDKSDNSQTNTGEPVDMLQVLHNITSEDEGDEEEHIPMSLASILGGDILGGKWFRKQFWYMLMITGMIVVYVANRYACQQEMIQTKVLSDTLLDRRYKALTRSSQLKERTRRSFIEQNLADSTLKTAKTPSFNLNVDEE